MENINKLLEEAWVMRIIHSIIVVIISILIYKMISYLLSRGEDKSNIKLFTSNKGKTYIKLMKSIIRSIFIILTVLILLQINGINVSSVLTGVGIFGVIFGLAIQDWLKDIIRGSSIISDNYFTVGDIVKYKEIEGKVLVIGLKTTKIQEQKSGNIISIANRNIDEITVISNLVHIRVPMPYEIKVDKAEEAIEDIIQLIQKNKNVKNCRYLGVTELASSSIDYLLEIDCNPQHRLQTRRDALRSVLVGLDQNKIEVPYTQIDIHNK